MQPINGMKIIDLSQMLAGPYCTMVLADMGAEVIKIERPQGDDARKFGPFVNDESYSFAMANRNKKSMALNLKTEKGKEILYRLVKDADVVVENFRPGVVNKMGIDYKNLQQYNQGLIYCSISGYGQTGPYSRKGGFDIIAQGMTGFMKMTGQPNDKPAKVGIAVNDIAAGVTAVYGILAAYIHKLNTGEGQYIDTSLIEAGLAWTIWEAAAYFGSGELPTATGTRHRRAAPYQAYRTSDGYVTVGAGNEKLWEVFCKHVINKPDWLKDDRFKDLTTRLNHADLLESEIEEITITKPTDYWVEKLDQAGVPGGPVYNYEQTLSDDHILSRDMVVNMDHPKIGEMKSLGIPIKLSKTPLSIREPAPLLGQHTTELLKSIGISDKEIDLLNKENIIYDHYR